MRIKPSIEIADEMLKAKEAMIQECYGQREEILKSFVAKYGFEPDKAMQIENKHQWFVIRLDDELRESTKKLAISERINREFDKWNLWQRFCIWLARV